MLTRSRTRRVDGSCVTSCEVPVEVQLLVLEHVLTSVHDSELGLLLDGARTFKWLAWQLRVVSKEWMQYVSNHHLYLRRQRLEQCVYINHWLAYAYLIRNNKGAKKKLMRVPNVISLRLPAQSTNGPAPDAEHPHPLAPVPGPQTRTLTLQVVKQRTNEEKTLLPAMATVLALHLPVAHSAPATEAPGASGTAADCPSASSNSSLCTGSVLQVLLDLAELDSRQICGVILKLSGDDSTAMGALEAQLKQHLPAHIVVERSTDGKQRYFIPTSYQFTRRVPAEGADG